VGWDAQCNVVRCRSHLGDEGIASKEHLLVCAFRASYPRGKPLGASRRVEGLSWWGRGRLQGWEGGVCEQKEERGGKEEGKEDGEARVTAEKKHSWTVNSVGGDKTKHCQ